MINLKIKISGPVGCGKSTLIKGIGDFLKSKGANITYKNIEAETVDFSLLDFKNININLIEEHITDNTR